ncbi:hemin-degrading factor [Chitiniphilus shinanonensis]|uniref:hemin-degrading factor n=1 Tax=Chitiniphilus shinanonensis TaxID=553088 RepID=UPI003027F71E
MNTATPTLDRHDRAELQARNAELAAAEPRLRIRDRAQRLGVSEAELVAAECGLSAVELVANGERPMQTLFNELGTLGRVMALSRNDWCVHERHGSYEDIKAEGPIGLVLGPDIDLRLFFTCWQHCYAVTDNGRRSIQFFDREGVAVHKVFLTEHSDEAAYDALVARYAARGKRQPAIEAIAVGNELPDVTDAAALREAWLAMTDTHQFFPLLRKFNVARLGALRAAGRDLAQPVAIDAVETMLHSAAASGLSIMCFVGNRGIVQIHSGPVSKLLRTGPWFNVLDPDFNLHLNTEAIAECWVVNKPTSDGWVTSLEVYAADGELIVQWFGERKPGKPELSGWRDLMVSLCATPLAE